MVKKAMLEIKNYSKISTRMRFFLRRRFIRLIRRIAVLRYIFLLQTRKSLTLSRTEMK